MLENGFFTAVITDIKLLTRLVIAGIGKMKKMSDKCLTREEIIEIVEDTIKNKKKTRKPSEYNLFIGDCTSNGETMKVCAQKWKEQKQ